ncbi:MAG: multifunctional CCA addition/repair protein [Gammaproteobacteria bacterium]|nr:multifunctional CCA addition/repair protein [Gammaproteobacteria bacterium]
MQIYLVGGAVRDRLLGRPVTERDFLVVGATPEQMLKLGYRQVGRDFPVFLHPQSKEEYALARSGRSGTEADAGCVTLEQDLARRDLTINAMAESAEGRLIDPFGGRRDLQQRLLRHVSPAFADDPLRVLRVARFMARYHELGFRVAPATMTLMRQLVERGDLDSWAAERVWQELHEALSMTNPVPFFTTLRESGALVRIMPELDRLWGVPQPVSWHPEIDCGQHSMLALQVACRLSNSIEVRFATLTHDLGKGLTPKQQLPGHAGHEARGAELVGELCNRLRAPNRFRRLAALSARFHTHCHRLDELKPRTILKVLEKLDAFRLPRRFRDFLTVCEADYRGRKGFETRPYPQAVRFLHCFELARDVDRSSLSQLPQGRVVGQALHDLRIRALKAAL